MWVMVRANLVPSFSPALLFFSPHLQQPRYSVLKYDRCIGGCCSSWLTTVCIPCWLCCSSLFKIIMIIYPWLMLIDYTCPILVQFISHHEHSYFYVYASYCSYSWSMPFYYSRSVFRLFQKTVIFTYLFISITLYYNYFFMFVLPSGNIYSPVLTCMPMTNVHFTYVFVTTFPFIHCLLLSGARTRWVHCLYKLYALH